jgi:hypothetical protein
MVSWEIELYYCNTYMGPLGEAEWLRADPQQFRLWRRQRYFPLILFCVIHGPGFSDHSHPDLPRVLHGLFDLLGNVTCQPGGF